VAKKNLNAARFVRTPKNKKLLVFADHRHHFMTMLYKHPTKQRLTDGLKLDSQEQQEFNKGRKFPLLTSGQF